MLTLSADQRVHSWHVHVMPSAPVLLVPAEAEGVQQTVVTESPSAYNSRIAGRKSSSRSKTNGADRGGDRDGEDGGDGDALPFALRWRSGCVANVGDPQGLARGGAGSGRVAVLGQGVQEFL